MSLSASERISDCCIISVRVCRYFNLYRLSKVKLKYINSSFQIRSDLAVLGHICRKNRGIMAKAKRAYVC
ncbi:DNA repair protein RadA, partial [Vibrio parahaemolyticus]|nr:DNA repair protein RadA [Vibrio parahaemolyticus]